MMTPNGFPAHKGSSPFPTSVPPYVGAVIFETFLYGLYTILIGICVYVLLRRNKKLHWILLASAVTMYSLATADMAYTFYLLFNKLLKNGLSFSDIRPKYWLYVTNNVLADSLLLYRCYVVWSFRKRVVAGPAVLLIAGTVCGYTFEGSTSSLFAQAWIYLVMTILLNVILTSLAAGRIWWLTRQAKQILGVSLLERYNATIAILIESGFLYSLYVILDLALHKNKVGMLLLDAGLIQMVGIMPTLIIVQVGLGRAVHDLEANDAIARLEASGVSSKIQIQSPTRSSFNMSYPDGIDARFHRTHSHSDDHGYQCECPTVEGQAHLHTQRTSACPCPPCSASSETFILHPHQRLRPLYLQDHGYRQSGACTHDSQQLRQQDYDHEHEHERDTEDGTPNTDIQELPDLTLVRSDMGLVCAELSERLEREHQEAVR